MFYKKMSLEELMNLDVTSVAKQPEPYREAPAAIQVITGDEIRRFGASGLPEALRLADNLDVAQSASSAWQISARGFNSSVGNKLLVLIDGRSVYTPLLSGVLWNVQDYLLKDIDRIEVVSGPGGTLWGANAINGVINIISKNSRETQGLYVESGGGSYLRDFAGVRYGGTLAPGVNYRLYAKYFDRGAEVFSGGESARDPWNQGRGGFRIDSQASTQNPWTLQGDFYMGKTYLPSGAGRDAGGNLLGRWTHTFTGENDLTLQLYYDRTHLVDPFPASGSIPAGPLTDNLDTVDLDFQDRFHLGSRNRFVWGMGYRFTHDADKPAPTVAFLPKNLIQNLCSGFAQDEIKLHKNVFVTIGSKLEHNDYTGLEYEPSVRLQWNVSEKQMLWSAISRAVRTPSRYDRDLYEPDPAYGAVLAGNSTFQSETVIAYELGYRAEIGGKVSGSLSAFYNDYHRLRSIGLTGGTALPLVMQNNNEGDTFGFELSADYQAREWWRLHGGYDLLREHIHVAPGQLDLFNSLAETADPEHQVFLRSSMSLAARVELDTSFRWVSIVHNNSGPTPGTLPAYADVDMRLGWHATKHVELSGVGQSLLHDQHAEASFPGPSQEQIMRSGYGEMTLRW